jgi:hypothetical protein
MVNGKLLLLVIGILYSLNLKLLFILVFLDTLTSDMHLDICNRCYAQRKSQNK